MNEECTARELQVIVGIDLMNTRLSELSTNLEALEARLETVLSPRAVVPPIPEGVTIDESATCPLALVLEKYNETAARCSDIVNDIIQRLEI